MQSAKNCRFRMMKTHGLETSAQCVMQLVLPCAVQKQTQVSEASYSTVKISLFMLMRYIYIYICVCVCVQVSQQRSC